MKKLIFGLLSLFCIGAPSHSHGMQNMQTLFNVSTSLKKIIIRDCFWQCNSIKEFKNTLNTLSLVHKKFSTLLQLKNVLQSNEETCTKKNIDGITKYKNFLKHIGFTHEEILLIAAKIGHLGLFKHYFNLETSPLHTEKNAGKIQSLQELLECVRDNNGNTVAHLAAKNGHKEIWDYLVFDLQDKIDLEGSRPLYRAIAENDIVKVQNLLKVSNKYVNGLNNHAGQQPFDYALKSFGNNTFRLEKKLFGIISTTSKWIINGINAPPHSPLFFATEDLLTNDEIVQELLDHGADKTYVVDNIDITHYALLKNNFHTFKLLCNKGDSSEIQIKNKDNESFLFYAGKLYLEHPDPRLYLEHQDPLQVHFYLYKEQFYHMYELFKEFDKPLDNQSTRDGKTLLHLAVEKNNKEFIKALLQLKASCSLIDNDGNTPLHLLLLNTKTAVDEEFCTLSQALMNQEVILTRNKRGETPLFLMMDRLIKITRLQEAEGKLLGSLLTHIKEKYEFDLKEEKTPTGITLEKYLEPNDVVDGNYFHPVQENPNIIVKIENKFWSLFKPLGQFINDCWHL